MPDMATDPLSILFVCQADFVGPTEKQFMGFAQRLVEGGHRVMFGLGGAANSATREGLALPDGICLQEHRFSGPRLRPSDRAAARTFAPAVIHVLNSRVPTVAAATDYARSTGAAVFVHFEDNEWEAWRGVPGESPYYRVGRYVRRLESAIHPQSWPHSTRRTRRWTRRTAAALDALTPELAAEVSARLKRPCATILPVSPITLPAEQPEIELPSSVAQLPIAAVTGTIYP